MRLWKLSNLMSRWMKISKALKHMVCMPKAKRGWSQSRHDKSGNRGRSKSKGKEKKNEGCFTCGATDHWKKNCNIWQERKAKAMARNSSSASVVTSDESDGELLAVTSSSNAFQHWILDTNCSFHMFANKEWFDT
ncbi:hypothetical protein LWI28_006550 [Acer negundo]|uniref:CCHC-type domain-containing protein n=1 Tax=Acer negundo TaxID=4023 RepID=A0AAD5ISX9_ACENE|nr:hypothetical protein LWI28_006550 [Acer negundo]